MKHGRLDGIVGFKSYPHAQAIRHFLEFTRVMDNTQGPNVGFRTYDAEPHAIYACDKNACIVGDRLHITYLAGFQDIDACNRGRCTEMEFQMVFAVAGLDRLRIRFVRDAPRCFGQSCAETMVVQPFLWRISPGALKDEEISQAKLY